MSSDPVQEYQPAKRKRNQTGRKHGSGKHRAEARRMFDPVAARAGLLFTLDSYVLEEHGDSEDAINSTEIQVSYDSQDQEDIDVASAAAVTNYLEAESIVRESQMARGDVADILAMLQAPQLKEALSGFPDSVSKEPLPCVKVIEEDQDLPDDLKNVNAFNDKEAQVTERELASIKIAYIPSGGGKTTLKKRYPTKYYDVDQLIEAHYDSWNSMHRLCPPSLLSSFRSRWYRYHLLLHKKDFGEKILLLNHPGQVPNKWRKKRNEVILLPRTPNFGLRWFDHNTIALLGIIGRTTIFSHFDNYDTNISAFFGTRRL